MAGPGIPNQQACDPVILSANPRFSVLGLLGRGAYGEVYRAHDRALGLDVAIKCLGEVSADTVVALKSEFRAAAAISHRNLVQLYELFVDSGSAYFSMELIGGTDFVTAGRRALEREGGLEELTRQLCAGLAALHGNGLVHRDIKPGNVLVTNRGRVVVLDFGFTRDQRELPATPSLPEGLVGTFAYMAPEQLAGRVVTSAADVYGVGALLYEVLTGAPPEPWTGAASVGPIEPDLSEPLAALLLSMLAAAPDARPAMATAAAGLDGSSAALTHLDPVELPFIGREDESRRLLEQITTPGDSLVVEIRGPSGVGKTELVRRVLADFATEEALILRSRCRITESVPFQALDAAIDELGVELTSRLLAHRDAELEDHAAFACALFPTLARVPNVEASSQRFSDPVEERRAASRSLRALLGSLARQRPVILWIDDAQWADADSVALLVELLSASEPSWSAQVILTTRTPTDEASAAGRALEAMAGQHGAIRYESWSLCPLGSEESERLVRALAGGEAVLPEVVSSIVAASNGSPFLLTSFSTILGSGSDASRATEGFASVLWSAISDLEQEERLILELVALCRQPTDRFLLLEAAGVGPRGIPAFQKLESRRLVRSAPGHGGIVVDSYHDQVPDTLLAALSENVLRAGHARLARVHEAHDSDPAILAHHFHGAGELPTAAKFAERAGHRAAAALAFSAAAEFFRSARTWDAAADRERVRALLELEGTALANAGALAEAGERYLEASRRTRGDDALELRRRAVESLLAGGRMDDAVREFRSLLSALGMRYPGTELTGFLGAVGSLLYYLLTRKLTRRSRGDSTEMLRIDTCYSAGRRLADIDPSRGTYFLATSLSRAARAGDRSRLARSLCPAGGALGAVAGRAVNRVGDAMMAHASRIAEELQDEDLQGLIDIAYGEIFMLKGRWRDALERSRLGIRRLTNKPGFVFECNNGRCAELRILEELGQMAEMYDAGQRLLESALAHRNAYLELRAVLPMSAACLALGRSAEARSHLRDWSNATFPLQQLYAMRGEALCDLYDGAPARGTRILDTIDVRFRRSVLRQIPLVRIDLHWLRGLLALASAGRSAPADFIGIARTSARLLLQEKRDDARLRATLLLAGAESWRDQERAGALAREAEHLAEALGMRLLRAAAAYRRCSWTGDSPGAERASQELAAFDVGEPVHYATTMVPGAAGMPAG